MFTFQPFRDISIDILRAKCRDAESANSVKHATASMEGKQWGRVRSVHGVNPLTALWETLTTATSLAWHQPSRRCLVALVQ